MEQGFHEHVVNAFGKVGAGFAEANAVVQGAHIAGTDKLAANAPTARM